jgi:hypothetical protein
VNTEDTKFTEAKTWEQNQEIEEGVCEMALSQIKSSVSSVTFVLKAFDFDFPEC